MLHSGSRGIGNHDRAATSSPPRRKTWNDTASHLPDGDLSYFPEVRIVRRLCRSGSVGAGLRAFESAQDDGAVIDVLARALPPFAVDHRAINCHHNYVAREHHSARRVVTRKGAIRAAGASSASSRAAWAPALHRARHGQPRSLIRARMAPAGDVAPRSAKNFHRDDLERRPRGVECRKDDDVLDEIPGAYKDIDQVMANQADLVEIGRIRCAPVLCVEGALTPERPLPPAASAREDAGERRACAFNRSLPAPAIDCIDRHYSFIIMGFADQSGPPLQNEPTARRLAAPQFARNRAMKIAQEVRAGNVIMVGKNPMVVQKAEFTKSGRNASVVKMKLKNLLSGGGTETVYRADEKFDVIQLEKKEVTYSYFADPMYVFMDRSSTSTMSRRTTWATRSTISRTGCLRAHVLRGHARSRSSCPTSVVREIIYTEPAVKGDTSGKVMKPAKLAHRLRGAGSAVRHHRRHDRDRHAHRRIPPAGLSSQRSHGQRGLRGSVCFSSRGATPSGLPARGAHRPGTRMAGSSGHGDDNIPRDLSKPVAPERHCSSGASCPPRRTLRSAR